MGRHEQHGRARRRDLERIEVVRLGEERGNVSSGQVGGHRRGPGRSAERHPRDRKGYVCDEERRRLPTRQLRSNHRSVQVQIPSNRGFGLWYEASTQRIDTKPRFRICYGSQAMKQGGIVFRWLVYSFFHRFVQVVSTIAIIYDVSNKSNRLTTMKIL